jgi:hypothetical protein
MNHKTNKTIMPLGFRKSNGAKSFITNALLHGVRRRWNDNIKMDIDRMVSGLFPVADFGEHSSETTCSSKREEFLDAVSHHQLSEEGFVPSWCQYVQV